jgi:hypothetical protein
LAKQSGRSCSPATIERYFDPLLWLQLLTNKTEEERMIHPCPCKPFKIEFQSEKVGIDDYEVPFNSTTAATDAAYAAAVQPAINVAVKVAKPIVEKEIAQIRPQHTCQWGCIPFVISDFQAVSHGDPETAQTGFDPVSKSVLLHVLVSVNYTRTLLIGCKRTPDLSKTAFIKVKKKNTKR